ncbi:hypothetical protein [Rubritalea sp.]|uniref:hypothetical protein n=1 Tax=Rubritalea sp. TaxID=2109375 RepID=UPI003EF9346A
MAKPLKKIKRWFENHGRKAGVTAVIIVVLAAGIWHATSTDEVTVQQDFGDASISDVAKEISNLSFDDALMLWNNGEKAKARAVMQRLAPLHMSNKIPQGNSAAHFWMAQDLLAEKPFGYLKKFPIEAAGGSKVAAPFELEEDELLVKALRHLEAAVELSPREIEPVVMLAEFLISVGRRNDALTLMLDALASGDGANADLGVYLANATCFKGDDLGLEEAGWHRFATLGQGVAGQQRGNVNVRLDYLFSGMLLKEFDAVDSSMRTFERDFVGQDTLISAAKSGQYYFLAIDLLKQNPLDGEKLVDMLLLAHQQQLGRAELVAALQIVAARFPELKARLGGALSQELPRVEDAHLKAELCLVLAEMLPAEKGGFLDAAVQAAPLNHQAVLQNVAFQLEQGSADFVQLSERLQALSSVEDEELLVIKARVAIGQAQWMEAIMLLEKALAAHTSDEVKRKEIHQLLAESYKNQGERLLAEEHMAQNQ